ncbi:hypothetical protein [Leifsonia sp. NPDC058248]|uniref:hypothetical protein n=1 Tax=Leifsonia sp. NPDC058248 TaxID=3346402 RepID=UPI0036DD9105
MSGYTVTAERSGKWWVLQAQEAPGAISQVSRLDQADVIKEAIAFVTGEPEDSIEITVVPQLDSELERRRRQVNAYRLMASEANAMAAYESRVVARGLAEKGLTVRDVGTILGVSPQRAHQLITDELVEPKVHLAVLHPEPDVSVSVDWVDEVAFFAPSAHRW